MCVYLSEFLYVKLPNANKVSDQRDLFILMKKSCSVAFTVPDKLKTFQSCDIMPLQLLQLNPGT
jgi:hypothetical protein